MKKGEIVLCKTYTGEEEQMFLREAQATGKTDLAAVPGASVTTSSAATSAVKSNTSDKPAAKPGGKLPDEPVDITAPSKPAPPAKKLDASLPAEP